MAKIWCSKKTCTKACFGTSTCHSRLLAWPISSIKKVSKVDVVKWWSSSRSKTQLAVSSSAGPVTNRVRYGKGSGVAVVGVSADVTAEPFGETPASGTCSTDGPREAGSIFGLGSVGLDGRLLLDEADGCGEGAEPAGDGVPTGELTLGGWVERLHSMPWRRQALQVGRVSSHWRVGDGQLGTYRVRTTLDPVASSRTRTLTLRCLQRRQPVRDLV